MKRLAIYIAVTFGLAWGLLIPAGLALGAFENGENSSTVMVALIALSMFFPLAGALAANLACRREDRTALGLRPCIGRNVRHYLAAWLAPAGLTLLGCVVFFAANPQWFDPSMRSYLETTAAAAGLPAGQLAGQAPPVALVLAASLTVAPLINMVPAFGEEIGWRGMLFPALSERMSERAAALASGAIWGLWHAPVIAMGHNYGMRYAGFPVIGILAMTIACTAMGCWLSLLRKRTGSVWPCALAHGAFNAVANMGFMFSACGATVFGPSPLGLVAGIPLFALGAICWMRLSKDGPREGRTCEQS